MKMINAMKVIAPAKPVRVLRLRCCECSRALNIEGADTDEIISKLDVAGWSASSAKDSDLCPNCAKEGVPA